MVACQAMSTGEIAQPAPRRRRSDGERSRRSILEAAAALATLDGLEGLSIGRLAERTGMSKSGLYAHFGSKQELQLATVETANEIFQAEVDRPGARGAGWARAADRALRPLLLASGARGLSGRLLLRRGSRGLRHTRRGRSGMRLRLRTPASTSCCRSSPPTRAVVASSPADTDLAQLAFELGGFLLAGNAAYVLFRDAGALEQGRRAVRSTSRGLSGPSG